MSGTDEWEDELLFRRQLEAGKGRTRKPPDAEPTFADTLAGIFRFWESDLNNQISITMYVGGINVSFSAIRGDSFWRSGPHLFETPVSADEAYAILKGLVP